MENESKNSVLDYQDGWHMFERDEGQRRILHATQIFLVPSIENTTIQGVLSAHASKLVVDTSGRMKMLDCLPFNIKFSFQDQFAIDPVFTLFYVSEHDIRSNAPHMLNTLPLNMGVSRFMAEAAGMWYERALGEAFLFHGKY